MWGGIVRVLLYLLIVTLPVWMVTFWGKGAEGFSNSLGRNFGLIGFMMLMMQFIIAARMKWVERAFGFDILIRFHRHMAFAAVGFLILHPLLLALGNRSWTLLIGLNLPWLIWVGKAALIIVIVGVLISLCQSRIGLTFERWRLGHNLMGAIVLVLICVHSWLVGDDLTLPAMQILWIFVTLVAATVFVYHCFIRPAQLKKNAYRVESVRQETGDAWTVTLAPPEGRSIPDYLPGQFHFVTFFRSPDLPVEEHHWTISSSPAQKTVISSTIKAVGDFTRTIGATQPGDRAAVDGPFGRFSYAFHPEDKDLVFLVGGIGITPVMAMLRHLQDVGDDRSVALLYGNRDVDQIIFREELEEIAAGNRPNLSLVHVLSRPDAGWTGEIGHVDRQRIEMYCGPNLKAKSYYICGPSQMAEGLVKTLRDMGVPMKQIRREIFSFLD